MPSNDSPSYFVKDPQATLDYIINWGDNWLGTDTISASTWTLPSNMAHPQLVKVTDTFDNDKATVWLSSGTVGTSYDVINRITTAGGRTDERTIVLAVRQK